MEIPYISKQPEIPPFLSLAKQGFYECCDLTKKIYLKYQISDDIILSCLGVGIEYKKLLIMSVLNHNFCYFSCPKRH